MGRPFFVSLIFSFIYLLCLGNAQDFDRKYKSSLVQGIIQKVFNLTLSSFANIPIKERENMMVKIEEKINKSAQFLGPKRGKYVDLIMEGVRSITSKNARSKKLDDIRDSNEGHVEKLNAEKQKGSTKVGIKERYFKKTVEKNQLIAGESYKHVKSPKQRKNILSDIQHKVKSGIKKYTPINKHDAPLLRDRDLIAQTMIKVMKQNANMKNENKLDSEKDDARRMEFEFIDNIDVAKVHNVETPSNEVLEVNKGDSNKIEPNYKNVTLKLPCLQTNTMICYRIKALRNIKCSGKDISVEKLCNGIDDCFDYSDEQDCAIQGVDKVRNASQIMLDIEHSLSNNCYTAKIDDSLIAKQNEILRKVLQSQLKFIQKHATATSTNSKRSNLRKYYTEPENVRKTVNEVAVVITTLSTALEHTLCSSKIEEEFRKFNNIDAIEKEFEHSKELVSLKTIAWTPHSCKCIDEYCVGDCSENCESVCLQRYQISRWQCKAVSNKKTIPLDLICDGKLDCYDEADENGCPIVPGFAKFEASNMYSLVLDMITTKTKSANFESVRNKLINLQILVEDLQNLTTKRKPDVLEVKTFRDQCFSVMTAIYDQTRYYAESMVVMNDIYVFLMSVNEKLVSAMKRSHIGNDRIIVPDGCFCRDNKCALPKCSQVCIRACPAEPKLTRYFCGGSMIMNQSIPIEAICNGKDDCPGKDDETDCSEDICRKHHLVVLRHNLQEATELKQDIIFEEVLKPWKIKVSATLRILESNERPAPKVLRDIVNDILHDLVMAYASHTSAKRRNDDDSIDKFYRTALVVMSSLRSCNK